MASSSYPMDASGMVPMDPNSGMMMAHGSYSESPYMMENSNSGGAFRETNAQVCT